ncbi:hypothetical protein K1719_014639 [Acacia pycnantha]|nr:hypothetical protein K1719_014519 [Acacia pycnantha]KAI9114298.1 hypothetical protein K1719_014526 [Acacia pycnantha]KAI9114411.1 hypothetical protein K1719_014639 [Acacia pycnantha]
MKGTRVGFPVFFVFLLLLASEGMATETQAIFRHPCQTPSKRFRGICVSDHRCAGVCQSEGHPTGECEGARRRCLCSVPC